MFGRRMIAAVVAEFLGTGILTLLVLSLQHSSVGQLSYFVSLGAGLAVAGLYMIFGNISGGHFNPALTLGLWTTRRIATVRAVFYIAVQMLGAYLAYLLYTYFIKTTLQPIGGEANWRIFTAEAIGAGVLALAYTAGVAQSLSVAVRGAMAGVGYVVGILAASSIAIGLLNPALALGVRAWVLGSYVLGPIVGAFIGVNLYHYLFAGVSTEDTLVPVAAATSVSTTASGEAVQTTTVVARKPRKAAASKTTTRKTTAKSTRKPAAKRTTRAR